MISKIERAGCCGVAVVELDAGDDEAAVFFFKYLSTAPPSLKISQRKTWPPIQRTGPWRVMASVVTKPCFVQVVMETVRDSLSLNMFMNPEIALSASSFVPGVGTLFWRRAPVPAAVAAALPASP